MINKLKSKDIIANIRLASQQITGTKFKSVKEIVDWMGAMQAQDYIMSKWAVGVRLQGSTEQIIEAALDKGKIIRTHLLRPTWHLVSSDDVYWMLELTAPQIRQILKFRDKRLELTEKIYTKSNNILEKALRDGKSLTREILVDQFTKAKIPTDENRASHLFLRAELDGLICSGERKGRNLTYALLEERVPKPKQLTKDEALATLAIKYFTSHCPATLQDFIWWSGLPIRDAKNALELIKKDFSSETIESKTYWFNKNISVPKVKKDSVYLLPAYDEYIISYKDRSAVLLLVNHKSAISSNGVFRPVIVVNGIVIGLWKRSTKKDKILIETALFKKQSKSVINLIEKSVKQYEEYLEKETEVKHNPLSFWPNHFLSKTSSFY